MDFSKIDLQDNQEIAREVILKAIEIRPKDRREFEKMRNKIIKKHKAKIFHNLYFIKAYNDLKSEKVIEEDEEILGLIQKRKVRTLSGVAPVTVLTKPFPCPGKCIYCPTDVRMPKSYLPSQPAAQRGFRQQFDPYTQVFVRLKALMMTGHEVSKVELRVLGGTWSSYPIKYREEFIRQCLLAMNEFYDQLDRGYRDSLENVTHKQVIESEKGRDEINTVIIKALNDDKGFDEVVTENESAKVKCIGVNVETRPDFVKKHEVKHLRKIGVTKVEMGVQTTDDRVQEITKRGHDLAEVRRATKLLKDSGFKMSYHMMPNLPGSTIEIDKKMIGELFADGSYQPDYLKIYPCMVIPQTELAEIFENGGFTPYDDETLEDILYDEMKSVPEWVRVDRVARDIPSDEIEAGSKVSNVRQMLERRAKNDGITFRDIRSREIADEKISLDDVELVVREYEASEGREFFISYEDVKNDKLIALLRLRLTNNQFIEELSHAALIREVHVYGKQIAVGKKSEKEIQHVGWGTKLMNDAERISKENGFNKIAVIAGIGTRDYYRKFNYKLEGTYMLKDI